MARGLDPRAGWNMGTFGGQLISAIMQGQNDRKRAAKVAKFDAAYPDFVNSLDPNLDPFRFQAELVKFANQYGISRGPELKEREALYAQVWSARQEATAKQDKTALTPEAIARRESIVAPYAKKAGEEVAFSETDPTDAAPSVPYGAQTRRDVNGQTVSGPLADTLDEASMTMQEIFDMALDEGMRTGEVGNEAREKVKGLREENAEKGGIWRKWFGKGKDARDELQSKDEALRATLAEIPATFPDDPKTQTIAAAMVRGGMGLKDVVASLSAKPSAVKRHPVKNVYQKGGQYFVEYGMQNPEDANDILWAPPRPTTDPALTQQAGIAANEAVATKREARDEARKLLPTLTGWKYLDLAEYIVRTGAFQPGAGKEQWTKAARYAKSLNLLSDAEAKEAVSSADSFIRLMKAAGLKSLKPLVGTTQISNQDVENVLSSMGDASTDPQTVLLLLTTNKSAIEDTVNLHNDFYGEFGDMYKLKLPKSVVQPEEPAAEWKVKGGK